MTSTVTTDFRHEFEAEQERWLRRRLLWYTGILGTYHAALLLIRLLAPLFSGYLLSPSVASRVSMPWIEAGMSLVIASAHWTCFFMARSRPLSRRQLLALAYYLIVGAGLVVLTVAPFAARVALSSQPLTRQSAAVERGMEVFAIFGVLISHFMACLFLPWTPREAARPLIPLLVVYAISSLFFSPAPLWVRILAVCLSPLIGVPGVAVAAWRHGRFRERFHFQMLKGRYGEIKQDLGFARQIHESLFPRPVTTGPVRFDYRYEPMRQIGGDYLFARIIEPAGKAQPILNLAIVDVTGHGIGAALTVNRLHGEIERQFGANPQATPGELLTGLNDYLHHTLASHSVYATAIFLRFDPNENSLKWASAGHPPAFLRAVDATIERLDSTTLVLGACRGPDFEPHEQATRFTPGDVLIAYTDGAIEARNQQGRMLTVNGLQRLIASSHPDLDGGWSSAVLRGVDQHRFGPIQDDTLIVEIYRPVSV